MTSFAGQFKECRRKQAENTSTITKLRRKLGSEWLTNWFLREENNDLKNQLRDIESNWIQNFTSYSEQTDKYRDKIDQLSDLMDTLVDFRPTPPGL